MRATKHWLGCWWSCLLALVTGACGGPGPEGEAPGPHEATGDRPALAASAWGSDFDLPMAQQPSRGLGRMTARVPGTDVVVEGVRLSLHHVHTTVHGGLARTQITEVFHNDTDQVLEGRFVFPLPAGASVSRLALWVGEQLVEGEMLERTQAARIFRDIVDDTVRPRDPALLEQAGGSEVSLKIFPIPARESRRVVLAYNEVLAETDGRLQYRYPLSVGNDRATAIDDFSVKIDVADHGASDVRVVGYPAVLRTGADGFESSYLARSFVPGTDLTLSYRPAPGGDVAVHDPGATGGPGRDVEERAAGAGESRYVAVRLRAAQPGAPVMPAAAIARVLVLDRSYGQGEDGLDAQRRVVAGLLARADPSTRFALLACDTACVAFPASGLAAVETGALREAMGWLRAVRAGGASDVGAALVAGAARLPEGGQLVYLGDGVATAGALSAEVIAAGVEHIVAARRLDVRLLGLGRSLDEVVLRGVASLAGAGYERVAGGASGPERIEELSRVLSDPVIARPELTVPPGFRDVHPRHLPNLRVGDELVVLARLDDGAAGGDLVLHGSVGGEPYRVSKRIDLPAEQHNPLLPRLWAQARIAELERSARPDAIAETVALSRHHHVLSRHTALLVLENERMFAEHGIARTQRRVGEPGQISPGSPGLGLGSPGLGDVGTIGHGAGEALGWGGLGLSGTGAGGSGVGEGAGLRARGRTAPSVRMGSASVSGGLHAEVIRRIVRTNTGRVRNCYELGLRRDPSLRGRVAVQFVIARDGSVASASASGSLGDDVVTRCIARAFRALQFPQPEGGIVTVVYPIVLLLDGPTASAPLSLSASWPRTPSLPGRPAVEHLPAGDSWRGEPAPALDGLREQAQAAPGSRRAREQLIREAIVRGRFDEALGEATQLAALDPDSRAAQRLLSWAAAVNGERERALGAVAAEVELTPRRAETQRRAAQAFEAAGDEPRACSHWVALAELTGEPRDRLEAWRCRARVRGDAARVVTELAAADLDPHAKRLRAALERGQGAPSHEVHTAVGFLRAGLACEGVACPPLAVIAPDGSVTATWAPAEVAAHGPQALTVTARMDGTYRTLMGSGRSGSVTLSAEGRSRSLPAPAGEGMRTAAVTYVGWR